MRKKTSKARRHRHHVKVLQAEVMSPRIAWFTFLSFLRLVVKVSLVLGLVLGAAYGIRQAIEHTFHRNPDFRLQTIDLNENDVLDENALVERLNIDLAGNIFDFEVEFLEKELLRIPGIEAAEVKRNLPGTLEFRIATRKPTAWISCPEENFPCRRTGNDLLVDHLGHVYPCPPRQVEVAKSLPVIVLGPDPDFPIQPERTLDHPQYKHCLHLLKSVKARYPKDLSAIDSIAQGNEWSLHMTTRSGTVATFGLGDHQRQLDYLRQALHHAHKKGYRIETINLIPKQNVPITVRGEGAPPRAIPVFEKTPAQARSDSRTEDVRTLLNRN